MKIHPVVFKVNKALRKSVQTGKHYLLAVSGGADSMALADAAVGLAGSGTAFSVCHVEHGLRGTEAMEDMELVRRFCAGCGLAFYPVHVNVRDYAATEGLSVEAAARTLRYDALRKTAGVCGACAILTAHHRDDQAETVLLRLLRGAGLDGLAAMEVKKEDVLRPLLAFSRDELEAYCAARQLDFRHDSSNDDVTYTRNRVRHQLLPFLRRDFNPNIGKTLARTASLLREDADCLTELASSAYAECMVQDDAALALDTERLNSLPLALRRRVLRQAYFKMGGFELAYERTEALTRLCASRAGGKTVQLPGSILVKYEKRKLIFIKNNGRGE